MFRKYFNAFSITSCNNGKYYVGIKIYDDKNDTYNDHDFKTNILVEIDLDTMCESVLRGVEIVGLSSVNEVNFSFMFVIIKEGDKNKVGLINNSGKIFSLPTKKYWKSSESDYDLPHKKKVLSRFFIVSKSDINITFYVDNKQHCFKLVGSENVQILKPNISGYRISVEIESDSIGHDITNIKSMVGYYD